MELIFNELSMNPPVANKFQAILKMQQFAQTVAAARKKGFKRIRSYCELHEITLAEQYSAQDWIHDKTVSLEMKSFLHGMIVRPFIKEDDEAVEAQYVEADYYFEKPENSCYGMAAAYLYDTVLISLAFSPIWEQHELELSVRKATILKPDFYMVKNIAAKTDFEVPIIADFVEQLGNITLLESVLKPTDKKIHLADHHGKKELDAFCNRLKKSTYVIAIRSTNWGGQNFIRKIGKDGSLEIVLVETQRQYALWVQTTGRNYRETEAIAKILEEDYS
jgi:hypothetical protein